MKKVLWYIGMTAVGIVVGLICGNRLSMHNAEVVIEKVDTLIVRDTAIIEKPVEKYSTIVKYVYVPVIETETEVVNDTVYVSLPFERKTYGDERYTAVVSGYKPSLDKFEIYVEDRVVTKYLIPNEDRLKKNHLSVGAEMTYCNAMSIPMYLEYERMLQKNVGIYGKMLYDVNARQFGIGFGTRVTFDW